MNTKIESLLTIQWNSSKLFKERNHQNILILITIFKMFKKINNLWKRTIEILLLEIVEIQILMNQI